MSQNDSYESFGVEMLKMMKPGAKVAVCGHTNPDGDSVSVCLAMAMILSNSGFLPFVITETFNERYDFLPGKEYIYTGELNDLSVDIFVALDCSSPDRLGEAIALFQKTDLTFVIDHHVSNTGFAKHNLIIASASSACEVIYRTMKTAVRLDLPILSTLFAGIVFDTGGFRHPNASSETFLIASEMVSAGVKSSEIQRRIIETHSEKEARIFAKAIGTLEIIGGVGVCGITSGDMLEIGCSASDLDGIAEYILKTNGVDVAVFLSERAENVVKVSLRSLERDICKAAAALGGGGHKLAAGASVSGSLEYVKNRVLELITKGA